MVVLVVLEQEGAQSVSISFFILHDSDLLFVIMNVAVESYDEELVDCTWPHNLKCTSSLF